MMIGTAEVTIKLPWVSSLKEKRMIRRSLIAKIKNKFNVSIAEIENMDNHKSLVIGFACVSNSKVHARSQIDEVVNYIYNSTDGIIEDIFIEML